MTSNQSSISLPSIDQRDTLADEAYERIRSAILEGALAPGQLLPERALADQLGVSATPVREALRRLEQDGLVEREANRSLAVSQLLNMPLRELLLIEAALRGVAARLAAEKITPEEVDGVRRALRKARDDSDADSETQTGRSQRFHELINQASHNKLLVSFLNSAYQIRRYLGVNRSLSELPPSDLERRQRDHEAIAEAVIGGDAGLAEERIIEHTLHAFEILSGTDEESTKRKTPE